MFVNQTKNNKYNVWQPRTRNLDPEKNNYRILNGFNYFKVFFQQHFYNQQLTI